jgi:hypothetical protein
MRCTGGPRGTARIDGEQAKPAQKETQMSGETVLLRVVDGAREGWKWMSFDDFLRQISIETWDGQQALVGMVLSPTGRETTRAASPLS